MSGKTKGDENMEAKELTYEEEVEMLIKKLQQVIKSANFDIKVEVTKNSITITNL